MPHHSRRRAAAMLLVMTLVFTAIGARLVSIQGVTADHYLAVGMSQRLSTVNLAGDRGAIFDRNGHQLAVSVPQTTFWANPHLVSDPRGEAEALSRLLPLSAATLQGRLSSTAQFAYLARRVDDALAAKVRQLHLAGVFSLQEPKRFLPDGSLASSVIGVVGTDNAGLSSLELQYDQQLAGRPGKLIEERDPSGSMIPGGLRQYTPPVNGQDLVLTIDRSLQYQASQTLAAEIVTAKAKSGMALMMDTTTGELLAVVSLTAPPATATATATATPPDTPAAPIPTASSTPFTDVFEPGSVNKLVTISAALQSGVVTPADRFQVPSSMKVGDATFSDAETHGVQNWTVTDILANSSNVGTITIAQKLGKDRINQYLGAFGFGQPSNVDFPGESAGLLPDPRQWSATSIGSVPIGQGVAVTAVQMLAAYNTIANGGVYVAPKLVAATVDGKGQSHATPPSPERRVVSSQVADAMTTMLGEVVRVGTGQLATIDGYHVAGKTGTARVPLQGARGYMDNVYESSFAGFVPAEHPAITGIVVLDQTPAFGGAVAAPAFSSIAGYGLREFRVPPPAGQAPPAGVPLATPQTAQAAGEKLPGTPSAPAGPPTPTHPRPVTPVSAPTATTAPPPKRPGTTGTTGTTGPTGPTAPATTATSRPAKP